jgi:ectoine hydroxylase-related dioxygenase (phytanoyl-CoA dioxygenase family)
VNNTWAFLPMRASSDLLGDPDALRARLDEDSYLYLPGLLDRDKVLALRHDMVHVLAERKWLRADEYLMDAISIIPPLREGEDAFLEAYDAVQKLEAFHTLAHDEALVGVMRDVVGPTAFPHPLKIARLSFPGNYEVSTPPHQDYPNNQGTEDLVASWIPVGDCPIVQGSLAVLRGSSRYGVLPLDRHPGAGNRQAVVPLHMLEELRWVTTDFEAGDVLLFPSTAVHASLHNASDFTMRLSVDFRYQQEGEPLTDLVLHPHFQRLTWDEVYEGWQSDEHQYYWRNLDYQVVPFEDYPLVTADPEEVEWAEILRHDHKVTVRYERRMARLAEELAPQEQA